MDKCRWLSMEKELLKMGFALGYCPVGTQKFELKGAYSTLGSSRSPSTI